MQNEHEDWDTHWIDRKIDQRTLAEIMKSHIVKVCNQCNGNITMSALILGISRATLYHHLVKFDIQLPPKEKKLPKWRTPQLEKELDQKFGKIRGDHVSIGDHYSGPAKNHKR